MALRRAQMEIAVSLFTKAFSTSEDKQSRKELFIQFCDAFDGSICDWKETVEQELEDEHLRSEFQELSDSKGKTDIKKYVTIEPLTVDDLKEISYLASKELDTAPWVRADGIDSLDDFVDGGYSFVAKRENVILGFILAYKCPTYGGYYYLYIDTFVVEKDAQGYGIGKMLLSKIRENMFKNRILSVKLMTQREKNAYQIYRHLGFEEMEDYVHVSKY